MAHTTTTQLSVDHLELAATWIRSEAPAKAVVLVGGATAVPHRFYARWAAHLADRGYDVLTFDYRGVGGSRPASLRSLPASLQDWGRRDLSVALHEAERVADGRPVLFVGHSFGGQALGLVDGGERLAGGVLVASGWGWWGFQPWWKQPGLMAVWYALIPAFTRTLGYVPPHVGLGEGLPGGVAEEWARWCRNRDYMLPHVPDARARFAQVKAPFHVFAISDDGYIPGAAVAELAAVLPGAILEPLDARRVEGGLGHFGLFRPQARPLWDDVVARLDALVA